MSARRTPASETAVGTGPPTLLVFTRGARRERLRRPLLPGRHAAAELELRRHCLESTLAAGRAAGCRLEVSSPAPLTLPGDVRRSRQHGSGFGERLEAACRSAAASAAGPLVVVGTDVPGLSADHLRQALHALAADPASVVLGPSPDGGFYLLAAARPLPGLAALTRWCRHDTLARLRAALAAAGRRVVLLAPLADLDRRGDLERWLARAPQRPLPALWRAVVRRLVELLDRLLRPLPAPPPNLPRPLPVAVRAPRGPPRRRR